MACNRTVALVTDSESLRNHLNINIDARRWEVYKTQTSSTVKIKLGIHFVTDSRNVKSPNVITNVLTIMSLEENIRNLSPYQCKSRKTRTTSVVVIF